MQESERGFTLLETLVACAIVAMLLVAGGFWMMGLHPGALAQATDDYDAAISSARALATTSSNGATLVFAPVAGRSGFTLRVYEGRPSGSNAVQPTTTMPVTGDATVSEKTLGAPPFAIFVGASGHVSGQASYPTIDAAGNATFAAIATEPACPAGGFVLTFTAPSAAIATRSLPCTSTAASAPGNPNPSPTPNVPIVTPPAVVYHWPADAQQTFVATEWGYTHWFATTAGFTCGSGVASFPNILPAPFSPAYSSSEANASPSPPPNTPYSYPNSVTSMNDAPASFPLNPAAAGLCSATVADEYGQRARTNVQVMGWLSATHGGKTYTHLSSPPLSLPSTDFPNAGSAVTISLSKTYDSEALRPAVMLDAGCSPYVKASGAPGATPSSPSSTPATASVTLLLVTMPGSRIDCGGTIYDQYPGSLGGEGITFNATLGSAEIDLWPAITQYPLLGFDIENSGGSICAKDQPRALDVNQKALTNTTPGSGFKAGFSTDENGCIQYNGSNVNQTGSGWDGVSTLIYEAGYSGSYVFGTANNSGLPAAYSGGCPIGDFQKTLYSNLGQTAGVQGTASSTVTKCSYGVTSADVASVGDTNTEGVNIVAKSCQTSGAVIYVPLGDTCAVSQATNDFQACQSGPISDGAIPGTFDEQGVPSLTDSLSLPTFSDSSGNTITDSNGATPLGTDFFDALGKHGGNYGATAPSQWTWEFHRVAAGAVTIYLLNYAWSLAPYASGLNYVCYNGTGGKTTSVSTMTVE